MASDLGETFALMKEERRKKKSRNLHSSLDLLEKEGIEFVELSPHHFRIGKYDFWPSTGKYLNREIKKYSRGVFNLLRELNPKHKFYAEMADREADAEADATWQDAKREMYGADADFLDDDIGMK